MFHRNMTISQHLPSNWWHDISQQVPHNIVIMAFPRRGRLSKKSKIGWGEPTRTWTYYFPLGEIRLFGLSWRTDFKRSPVVVLPKPPLRLSVSLDRRILSFGADSFDQEWRLLARLAAVGRESSFPEDSPPGCSLAQPYGSAPRERAQLSLSDLSSGLEPLPIKRPVRCGIN